MNQQDTTDIELRSPATVLASQLEEDPPADAQPMAHRLQLETVNTRTATQVISDKNIRTISSTFVSICKSIPSSELAGNALQDAYKAASNV